LPSGKMLMWMAKRIEAFNFSHCNSFSIVYNIDR